MKLKLTTAVLVTALATPAWADCKDDLAKAASELSKNEKVQMKYRSSAAWRGAYNTLAAAARTFASNGMEDRCQDVVKGMRELAEKRTEAPDGAKDDADSQKDSKSDRKEKRMAYLKAARPLSKASISVETLTGLDVRNHNDEDLGDVSDVILRTSGKHTAIIGRGGFIGMGVAHYRVPFSKLSIQTGTDDYSPVVVLNVTPKEMEGMPKVEKKDGRWVNVADSKSVEDDDKE